MKIIFLVILLLLFIVVIVVEFILESKEENNKCYYRMERRGRARKDMCPGAGDTYERNKCGCKNCEYYKRWIAEAKR